MDNGQGGCSFCGRDENHERYLRWEAETEKWAKKYRSGELTEVPAEILSKSFAPRSEFYSSLGDSDLHPAIRGFMKFKYEDMSLFEFLNIFSLDKK